MITEENIIRITATFNEQRTHRYSLKRQWSDTGKSATIIMSNASTADLTKGDLTSMLIQNNLSAMDFASVTCVNLFSFMCNKLDLSGDISKLTNDENTAQILKSVQETDITIVAIGTLAKTYKKVAVYQNCLFERLHEYQPKIHTIAAPDGSEGLHPLSAKLREAGSWTLIPFRLPETPLTNEKEIVTHAAENKKPTTGKPKKNEKKVVPLTS